MKVGKNRKHRDSVRSLGKKIKKKVQVRGYNLYRVLYTKLRRGHYDPWDYGEEGSHGSC